MLSIWSLLLSCCYRFQNQKQLMLNRNHLRKMQQVGRTCVFRTFLQLLCSFFLFEKRITTCAYYLLFLSLQNNRLTILNYR